MPARILPIRPLDDAVDDVLRSARAFVQAVHQQDQAAVNAAYPALDTAVHSEERVRDAHSACTTDPPTLTVIDGGLTP